MIVDNFLHNFHELVEYAKTAEFKDETNYVDNVVYPLICSEIPEKIKREVAVKLGGFFKTPKNPIMFMRRSPKDVECPHKAHSDNSMGKYSLMLYMSDEQGYGTSLLNHKKTGAKHTQYSDAIVSKMMEDQNNDDAWEVYQMTYGKPNRAFIFDAHLMHRAEPIGGFGEGANARTVLTCFFS